jgi:hypothetical protein
MHVCLKACALLPGAFGQRLGASRRCREQGSDGGYGKGAAPEPHAESTLGYAEAVMWGPDASSGPAGAKRFVSARATGGCPADPTEGSAHWIRTPCRADS